MELCRVWPLHLDYHQTFWGAVVIQIKPLHLDHHQKLLCGGNPSFASTNPPAFAAKIISIIKASFAPNLQDSRPASLCTKIDARGCPSRCRAQLFPLSNSVRSKRCGKRLFSTSTKGRPRKPSNCKRRPVIQIAPTKIKLDLNFILFFTSEFIQFFIF